MRQSGDILSWGSPLMGHMVVRVPGSGTWVQCRHGPIYGGGTGATLGVADIGAGTGVTSGIAGVCGFGVTGVTGRGCGSCVGLAGAGDVAEM